MSISIGQISKIGISSQRCFSKCQNSWHVIEFTSWKVWTHLSSSLWKCLILHLGNWELCNLSLIFDKLMSEKLITCYCTNCISLLTNKPNLPPCPDISVGHLYFLHFETVLFNSFAHFYTGIYLLISQIGFWELPLH